MKHVDVLKRSTELLTTYLDLQLPRQGIGRRLSPLELKGKLDLRIGAEQAAPAELIESLQGYLAHAVGTLDPGFMNQLFSGLSPWALAGELASIATNTTMATFEASPVATLMEKELVALLADYAGWKTFDGIMVTGGSNANLVGLLMARNRLFPDIRQTGPGKKILKAYVSEDAHYSFEKAMNIMGLGVANLQTIATDSEGQMRCDELKRAISSDLAQGHAPFFIGATAGTTVLGAFDPIRELATVAKQHGVWLHVDGAWGGSVLVSSLHRALMDGISDADSLGWDHHKMLGTGLVSSFFLTRHERALTQSHSGGGADYIFHESEVGQFDLGKSSLQCGRRTDAVKTWFAWKASGRSGMEATVNALMALAQDAGELVREDSRLELLCPPTSLNVCFKIRSAPAAPNADWYRRVREQLMGEGRFMVNMATRKGESFIRLIIVNPDLDVATLKTFFSDISRVAHAL